MVAVAMVVINYPINPTIKQKSNSCVYILCVLSPARIDRRPIAFGANTILRFSLLISHDTRVNKATSKIVAIDSHWKTDMISVKIRFLNLIPRFPR